MGGAAQTFQYEADPAGREANFVTLRSPAANLATGSSDEVEIQTGISIVDRAIIRILGLQVQGIIDSLMDAMTAEASDVTMALFPRLQTRTGQNFNIDDPEFVVGYDARLRTAAGTDNHEWFYEYYAPAPGGSLVATPRLVYRLQNLLGGSGTTTVTADDHRVRIAFEFVKVNQNTLIELLERHADIFLA